jgi:hypothetical protein
LRGDDYKNDERSQQHRHHHHHHRNHSPIINDIVEEFGDRIAKHHHRHSDNDRQERSRTTLEIDFKPSTKINPDDNSIKEPKNLKKWSSRQMKGSFFINTKMNGIIANSYTLDLNATTNLFISIEAYKTTHHTTTSVDTQNMDLLLLIIKDGKRGQIIKGITDYKAKSKWYTQIELKAGRYLIYPFTSGCHLKKRIASNNSRDKVEFFKKDLNKKLTLSRQLK